MSISDFPLPGNLAVFAAAACGVWFAGSYLTAYADLLAERTGLGQAFAGVLLLGVATSLPEIATTATASYRGNAALAGSNLLGGVAMQIAVLAFVDAVAMRGRALTFFAPQPALMIQGVLLILLTASAAAAVVAGEPGGLFGIGVWSFFLAGSYVIALYIIYRYEGHSRWEPSGDVAQPPESARKRRERQSGRYSGTSTVRAWLGFGAACLGVLVSGWVVSVTGEAIAEQTGIGLGFVGATLVALATSLPEISTTFAAIRTGAYAMAVGNIFGTNCLEIALLAFADLFYRDGLLFNTLDVSSAFLAALGIVVTCIYLWGILERRDKTVLGMGVDSAAVAVVYLAGLTVYYFLVKGSQAAAGG